MFWKKQWINVCRQWSGTTKGQITQTTLWNNLSTPLLPKTLTLWSCLYEPSAQLLSGAQRYCLFSFSIYKLSVVKLDCFLSSSVFISIALKLMNLISGGLVTKWYFLVRWKVMLLSMGYLNTILFYLKRKVCHWRQSVCPGRGDPSEMKDRPGGWAQVLSPYLSTLSTGCPPACCFLTQVHHEASQRSDPPQQSGQVAFLFSKVQTAFLERRCALDFSSSPKSHSAGKNLCRSNYLH